MSSAQARMIVSVALVAALFLLAAWIAWLASRLERRRIESREQGRRDLLARATDPDAYRSLVESGTADRLLGRDPWTEVRSQVIRSVRWGIVALFSGSGLVMIGIWLDERLAGASGFLLSLWGAGLLVAAWATHRIGPARTPEPTGETESTRGDEAPDAER